MSIQTDGDRHTIEFQFRGKRVHRRLPLGATQADAEQLERRLRRGIFASKDLGSHTTDADPDTIDTDSHEHWLRLANLLLKATGVQPRPGVYFLCNADQVVYVGQSRNVACRLANHRGKGYDRALMIETPVAELPTMERFFIRMLRPPLNRTK